jgi:uncharacterized protein (TIGR02145 family)
MDAGFAEKFFWYNHLLPCPIPVSFFTCPLREKRTHPNPVFRMKIHLILLSFLFVFSGLNAQTVIITNVEQDGQELVVSYDITGGTGKYEVSLYCSTDDGTTWAGPLKSVSGDVGKNIAAGLGKKITWTVLSDRADLKGDQIRFKVKASKGEGTVADVDGNRYETVRIGDQVWMKENLKVSHYQNGDPIPTNLSHNEWEKTTSGAFAIYENKPKNNSIYGKLYNWYSVVDKRSLCPIGWHVPSDKEWANLENHLGGPELARGKMKSTTGWDLPDSGVTNESGFSGLPGGMLNDYFFYIIGGNGGFWWSSTEYNDFYAFAMNLYNDRVNRNAPGKPSGLSVRCLRD